MVANGKLCRDERAVLMVKMEVAFFCLQPDGITDVEDVRHEVELLVMPHAAVSRWRSDQEAAVVEVKCNVARRQEMRVLNHFALAHRLVPIIYRVVEDLARHSLAGDKENRVLQLKYTAYAAQRIRRTGRFELLEG